MQYLKNSYHLLCNSLTNALFAVFYVLPSLLLRKLRLSACMLSCFSHVQLSATLQIVAHQAPLSMGFSRQKYWSGLPCLPPGDPPNTGIKPASLMSPAQVAIVVKNPPASALSPPGKPKGTS